ncbi:hypothetical protein [Chitinophaga sp.]|uniref:hypothetical protein n=1 Tax=Chitinophaga sp. TaxID=1869181 RepID=UPI0031D7AB4B
MKRRILWLLILLWPVCPVLAQDMAWKDMQQLCTKYGKITDMHYKAKLKMYSAKSPSQLIDQLNAVCHLQKDHYYAKVGAVEILKTPQYLLTIDNDDKLVVVTNPNTKGDKMQHVLSDVGGLLEAMKVTGVRMQKVMRGNATWLELSELPDADILACNIQYDPATYLINSIWMRVIDPAQSATEPVIVEIVYDYKVPAATTDQYNDKRYIRITGREVALQAGYKNYTLINQL